MRLKDVRYSRPTDEKAVLDRWNKAARKDKGSRQVQFCEGVLVMTASEFESQVVHGEAASFFVPTESAVVQGVGVVGTLRLVEGTYGVYVPEMARSPMEDEDLENDRGQ